MIEFLKFLKPPSVSPENLSKIGFCSSYVVPKAIAAARYIGIYRQVKEKGHAALAVPDQNKGNRRQLTSICETDETVDATREVVRKLDDLIFSSDEAQNSNKSDICTVKKVPKQFVIRDSQNSSPKEEIIAVENCEIKAKVSTIINDLLKLRLQEKSKKYLSPYSEDIKEDLRSFIPARRPQIICPSSTTEILTELKSCSEEFNRNTHTITTVGNDCELSNSIDGENPYVIKIDVKSTDEPFKTSIDVGKSHLTECTTLPSTNKTDSKQVQTDSMFLNRTFQKFQASLNSDSGYGKSSLSRGKYRSVRSENFCPEYDWFGGNTLRKKKKTPAPSIWVRDIPKDGVESSKGMTYSEWLNRERKSFDSEEDSSGSYQDIISINSINSRNEATLSDEVYQESLSKRNEDPLPGESSEQTSKSYFVNQPLPSGIGDGFLVPQGYNEENNQSTLTECNSISIKRNPIFVNEKTDEVVTFPSRNNSTSRLFRSNAGNERRRSLTSKVKRAPTWRYGQEPCPENYESKLMGKIDLTKRYQWERQGLPSTLAMPGYIYDEGVLTETRC